ncbi:E3 ubiquitin/ISG15 ligase TRIM25 [Tachyglossus aculeatus]|uniref:E3 ubiquitin/ISG15 ligase TRIM25 n=1 Tax=Tachyglossus aculeatus TaxID=9261 RepID=UPI0018F4FDEB|nr:E3 ubiquitin/ISG15 ligase TRIM25 [Tachyglossus aculeatus]
MSGLVADPSLSGSIRIGSCLNFPFLKPNSPSKSPGLTDEGCDVSGGESAAAVGSAHRGELVECLLPEDPPKAQRPRPRGLFPGTLRLRSGVSIVPWSGRVRGGEGKEEGAMAEGPPPPPPPPALGLAEELTCPICLEVFQEAVTTPCGHNFCLACLSRTWAAQGAQSSCPQCRAAFPDRPRLQRNTVLCGLAQRLLLLQGPGAHPPGAHPPGAHRPVPCDLCPGAPAVNTCLTCEASFCLQHLRPHLDSPAFRHHTLREPLGDLQQRKCPRHSRLAEFFCPSHGNVLCPACLPQHKACDPLALPLAQAQLATKLKQKLITLYGQDGGAAKALEELKGKRSAIQETTARKLDLLKTEFAEMKALIEAVESDAVKKVKEEEERVLGKLDIIHQTITGKKKEMQNLKEQIELVLEKPDEFSFLEKAAKLQGVFTKDVYLPEIELNQELIQAVYHSSFSLKEVLKRNVKDLHETRAPAQMPFPGRPATHPVLDKGPWPSKKTPPSKEEKKPKAKEDEKKPKAKAPGVGSAKATPSPGTTSAAASASVPAVPSAVGSKDPSASSAATLQSFLSKSRQELLEYATKVIFDFNTAHPRVVLSDGYSVASVSDVAQPYCSHPQRFTNCSQVLGWQCYKSGVRYWEAELRPNNFCGVGVCYGSTVRQGASSRLGRNAVSWCVEWFNGKLSAWHADAETTLPKPKASRVGVLLHYDAGFVAFFAVSDKVSLLYKYKASFSEALYPAFWLFASGTSVALIPLM